MGDGARSLPGSDVSRIEEMSGNITTNHRGTLSPSPGCFGYEYTAHHFGGPIQPGWAAVQYDKGISHGFACVPQGGGAGGGGGSNSTLSPGQALSPGGMRTSPNGQHVFIYQTDGNLVLYGPSGAVWASCTNGQGVGNVQMQGDGNLVMYVNGVAIWNTVTFNNPGAYLSVRDDGMAVVNTSGGSPVWSSTVPCH